MTEQKKDNRKKRSRLAGQRGSGGDSGTIIGVLVLCAIFAVGSRVLGWIKSTKDAKVETHEQFNAEVRDRAFRNNTRGAFEKY